MSGTHWSKNENVLNRRLVGRCIPFLFGICAVLLAFVAGASAQTTASISGTVKDITGAIIPGAKVVLLNEASKATRSTQSNDEGFFSFAAVQPGATYSVTVTYKGFETWVVTGIVVHPDDNLSIPKINLKAGKVVESVTVTAESAGVSLNNGEHGPLITAEQIQRLATVGRDTSELISIVPGFTLNGGGDNQGPDYEVTGFGNGNLGSYGALGAMHQTGAVNVTADGANLIDPGDMGGQISNVNMDQVQEVKIQTSNFSADEAKGPIVLNAVGKSGGSAYHGSAYIYLRNYAMNGNDWVTGHLGGTRPETKYFYPGGSIGGPIKIPGTSFNRSKRLVFWAGYEYYGQQIFNGVTTAFVPTASMLGGDLSPTALGAPDALNVPADTLPTNCPNASSQTALYENIGGMCVTPGYGVTDPSKAPIDPNGGPIMGGIIQPTGIDPGVAAFTRFWPAANHTATAIPATATTTGAASQGYNYVHPVVDPTNGYQIHSRVDENFSDNLKLYVTYNYEWVNYSQQLNSSWNYQPTANVPLPTPFLSHSGAHTFTGNLTKTINASLTNELQASIVYFTEPGQYANRNALLTTGTPWAAAGYSGGATGAALNGFSTTNTAANSTKIGPDQMPELGGWEGQNIPGLSEAYTDPNKGQFLNKYSGVLSDNVTKIYKKHSFKTGFYSEMTANNSANLASMENGAFEFMRWGSCLPNQALPQNLANLPTPTSGSAPSTTSSTGNEVGQFLIGCPLYYGQDLSDPSQNMRFTSLEGYVTDEWKVVPKLTLTLGIRLSHIGPWVDRDGLGVAVWDPSALTPHVLLTTLTSDPKTWTGIKWHAIDSSVPLAGVPTRPLFYSPRFSMAYDLYGNGKTVFRGGWGAYRYHDNAGFGSNALATAQGKQTWTLSNVGTQCTFAQIFNTQLIPCGYYNRSSVSSAVAPFQVTAVNPHDDELPVTYNYNFTLDQSLPQKISFELSYVGNQSTNLLTQGNAQNQNVIPMGAFYGPDPVTGVTNSFTNIPNNGTDYRPYPNYTQISVPTHVGWGNYNSMEAQLNKQTGSIIFGLNYTRSKNLAVNGGADPLNLSHDYGPTGWDRRNVVNLTYSWQEGTKFHGNKVLGSAINGWEVSGIASWQSGYDLTATQGGNFGFSGGANYNNVVNGVSTPVSVSINGSTWLGSSDYNLQPVMTCDPHQGLNKSAHQFINSSCFGISPQGTQGWWQLPFIPGPAYYKWDMSVFKDFKMTEKQNMQFRVDGHNFLNHPLTSFASKDPTLPLNLSVGDCPPTATSCPVYTSLQQAMGGLVPQTANFGSTTWKAGERILEMAFKYNF